MLDDQVLPEFYLAEGLDDSESPPDHTRPYFEYRRDRSHLVRIQADPWVSGSSGPLKLLGTLVYVELLAIYIFPDM